jgi:hypothetical protein
MPSLFDKAKALQLIRMGMDPASQRRVQDHELALAAALDELSMRMRSASFLYSYTETIAAQARTATLTGENDDLRSVFALKLGSGTEQRVLEYTEPQVFLRDYDSPAKEVGRPARYTILQATDDGNFTVKFDCPLESSELLTCYYYRMVTPDNLDVARNVNAAVAGALAYFYGKATAMGAAYAAQFRELAALSRASDSPLQDAAVQFYLPQQDREIRKIQKILQSRRQ